MALIKGIHHEALKCADWANFEETCRFYGEVLGMQLVRTWGEGEKAGAMYATGNSLIEIFASGSAGRATGSINHLALATDDTDACIEAVRAAGYEITMEPRDIVIRSTPEFPARVGFARGPVGEEIEFFCEK